MEKLKSITIIFLLAVGLLASAASAKSASVLLQEGLYAEEIEGDLDAAIKIYEQVIAEAKETQRAAAQATYRIGMCFLKKGQKDSAAEYFQKVVSNFPEKKSLVTKARKQLAKLEPIGGFDSAESVPVDQLIKSGKVPAFKTQIYDNTGLDLETGVSVPFMNEWPSLCDVAWDNDGGGALMIKPSSSVRFLALGAAEKWEDAISMARNSLGVLRTSTSEGMFASQSKFVAVLTSEGNLAVIQIGDYDAKQGTIYGWVEKIPAWVRGFGPVMERVINDDGVGEDFMFDLDTGKSFSVSDAKKWSEASDVRPEKSLEDFVMKSGVDLFGETSKKSLMGIDMIAMPIHNERWDMSPEDVIEQVSMGKPGTPVALSADGELPKTFVFKTEQGGMGILQIIEMQAGKAPRHFKIRYKMLQKESSGRIVFLPDADDVIQQGKVAVVLDLTTGKMLPGNKDKQYFNKLNKGDVAYFDDEGKDLLVCFRGAKITRKTANGKYYDTPDQSHTDNTVHIYIIKKTPAEWTITTKEGDIYELKVLSLDNNQAKIKYRKMFRYKMLQGETAQLRVSSHKVFLPECDTTVYDLLDLASSRIINSEPGGEVLDLSKPDGKGNLYFDKAKGQLWLVGVRGTRMRLRSGGELLSSEPDFISRGIAAYYLLGEIPCQYLVTTAQGDKYELKVFSMDAGDRPGVHIEYWKSAESPGAFDVATGVRGGAAKAMELLSGLKALMFGVVGAVESDDPNTALLLLDKLIAQSKQFKSTVKDTSVEAAVKAGLEMLDPLRDALEKKQMGRAKSLLAALNQMGPAVESALEKKAAQQKIAAKHSRRLADTIAEMGWDLRTVGKAERGGDLRKSERFDKAEEMFKKALRKDPANASALKGLAVTYMERKDYDEAIRYYQMWLDAEPDNSDAKAGLEKAKAALKGK